LAAAFHQGRFPLPSQIRGTWVEIGSISSLPGNQYRYLSCSGEGFRNGKLVSVLIVKGDHVEMYFNDGSQSDELRPDHRGSVEFSRDFYADGAKETYRCRLTKRGTLACLFDPRVGAEFKKMKVNKSQLVEASSWN
jgi:hypothetical protein